MPAYQIHRLKDSQRQQFRWAPHTSGITVAKPKDYTPAASVDAESPYGAWLALRGTDAALDVGDILEAPGGEHYAFRLDVDGAAVVLYPYAFDTVVIGDE